MADGEQLVLGVPVRAVRCEPSDFGTADCAQVCRCDDGSDYAVKDEVSNASVPHSEWFCTRLGELVGLASPPCKVVDVRGKACFGSRWETGHNAKDWWLRVISGAIDLASIAPTLSRIFAFDLFVNNIDRHMTNYIVREQHFGTTLLAFDYSRAWLVNGMPPPDLPMAAHENTTRAMRWMQDQFGHFFSINDAKHVLDRLDLVDHTTIQSILMSHPPEWLTTDQRDGIIAWWQSGARSSRINSIRKGVKDGTYL
jgi:hypothetical protein